MFKIIIFSLLFIGINLSCFGQILPDKISDKELNKFSKENKILYLEGIEKIDHIIYQQGAEKINKCASNEINNVPIQFYNTKLHSFIAFAQRGTEAKKSYEKAIASLQRIINNPTASDENINTAKGSLEMMKKYLSEVDAKDERSKKINLEIMQEIAKEKSEAVEKATKATSDSLTVKENAATTVDNSTNNNSQIRKNNSQTNNKNNNNGNQRGRQTRTATNTRRGKG